MSLATSGSRPNARSHTSTMAALSQIAVIATSVIFLAGCPSPPLFKEWKKTGATEQDVRRTMLDCGFPNVGTVPAQTSRNDTVKMYQCMEKNGFRFTSDFKICEFNRDVPACIEQQRGYPVSIVELEALPFDQDPGFWTLLPQWNSMPSDLIPWHPGNASRHFKERTANLRIAMADMLACGYPNPLGSGSPASIGETARAQVCMQKKGYVPDRASISSVTMIPVCRQYPVLPVCAALEQDGVAPAHQK